MAGVNVRIGADTDGLEAGIARSKKSLSQLRSEMNAGIQTAAKYGAAAAAAGTALAVGLAAKGLQAVDAQAKLAKQLSTTSASVATLSRAADLSGIRLEQVNSGVRQFTVRLAQAADGAGPANEALRDLGLSAQQLSSVPLDQRISAVTQAINEQVPASQQAAAAAKLFGEEAGLAFSQLSPEVLAQARREAELFGTAISDIDAAQVEAANDAFSTMALALQGVSNRLAVELAPILTATSRMFMDAAEEAGGFGQATSDAFQFVVDSAAFVMDAVEGIKRTFSLVADGIIVAWNTVALSIAKRIEPVLAALDYIPGIDTSEALKSIQDFSEQATSVARQAVTNMHETMNAPMPSARFQEFVAQAREQAETIAEEGLNLTDMLLGTPEQFNERADTMLDLQEKRNELQLERQRNAQEMMTKIQESNDQEQEKKKEKHGRFMAKQEDAMWNQMTSLMNSGSRTMFEIGKTAALAQAGINAWEAVTGAYKFGANIGGPALGAAFAAAAGAAQAANIQRIASQSFGGGGSGGGTAPTAQINEAAQGVQGQAVQGQGGGEGQTLTVQGIDPDALFSGRQLVDIINQAQKDGAVLQVSQ